LSEGAAAATAAAAGAVAPGMLFAEELLLLLLVRLAVPVFANALTFTCSSLSPSWSLSVLRSNCTL
jgi:hypothetical protein